MLVLMAALVGGLFVSMVGFQRQIGDLRVEIHQEIGALRTDSERQIGDLRTDLERQIGDLRTDLERQINDLRTDLGQRMARLEAIMEVHFGTPSLPADGAEDSAPAQ